MRPVRLVLLVSIVAVTAGCNGKNPLAPAEPGTATATGLVINGADAILTGLSAGYTAVASFSDGTTRTVIPTWISSDPGVGSVDSAGHVDGRTHGSTNLSATYSGRNASKTIRVINNYGGTWDGRYVVRACTDSGDLTDHDGGWCRSGEGRVGTVGSIRVTLSQTGSDLSVIDAAVAGESIKGVVTPDGRLKFSGTLNVWDWDHEIIIARRQITWDTNLQGSGAMTGGWSEDLASLYFRIGNAHMENEFITLDRTTTGGVVPGRTPIALTFRSRI
jgi:hypothetical protein